MTSNAITIAINLNKPPSDHQTPHLDTLPQMLAIQQPRPLPLSVYQAPPMTTHFLPPLPELRKGTVLGRGSFDLREGPAVSEAHISGLQTPPLDMDVNPLLAPNYGPVQYKGVPVVASNTLNHQSNRGSIGNTTYISRAQPLLDSYQTHRSQNSTTTDGSRDGCDGPRAQQPRRRNSDGSEIVHYLQIPSSINDSKGSLAEFAAQVSNIVKVRCQNDLIMISLDNVPVLVRILHHSSACGGIKVGL